MQDKFNREPDYRSGGESEASSTPLRGTTPKYVPFNKKMSSPARDGFTSPVALNCMSTSI